MTRAELEQLPWIEVKSSNVLRLAWSGSEPGPKTPAATGVAEGRMFVDFSGDKLPYVYERVPRAVFQAVERAHSVGGMLNKIVKPKYAYSVIELDSDPTDPTAVSDPDGTFPETLAAIAERLDAIDAKLDNLIRLLAARTRRTITTGGTA